MTGPRAPAGWYPDPSDTNVVRYWDGTAWTDLAATPAQPLPVDRSKTTGSPPDEAAPIVRESTTAAWAKIGIALLVALMIIGIAVYASESRGPDSPFGDQPAKEQAVVELIEAARQEYDAANHDLQRDAAVADRDERICAILGDGRVENWTGKIYEIDSSSDGQGIIGINIEPNTQVTTRGNAFSTDDNTLITPGPLLDRITELEEGQLVTFSGRFVPDEDGRCFANPRLTQRQSIDKPLMVFRFSDVRG